jgi:hypothetical protein
MDALREQAERQELDARRHHEQSTVDDELRRHDVRLRELDAGTRRYERERERAMREELAQQEAADRAAQAQAVASALRRT